MSSVVSRSSSPFIACRHIHGPFRKGHVSVVIETHKACLNVKTTGARSMRVVEILTEVGVEVKEGDHLLMVEKVE